jgi:hypothetical protein
MLSPINQFFEQQQEPFKSCFAFLRGYILKQSPHITEEWKYGLPFYYYKGKMFCYLWTHKKHKQPYIGIVKGAQISHPNLLQEKRKTMKILLVDPTIDIPLKTLNMIFKEMLGLYQ